MTPLVGYCTNVHAGADLDQTRSNLERYAVAVRQRFSPDRPMPIGLWLSASTANSLIIDKAALEAFRAWLGEAGLRPYTLNGFPSGDFHSDRVKHDVYLPTWAQHKRLAYTIKLIDILHAILPEDSPGSISTLPLAWGSPAPTPDELSLHAMNLSRAADYLARLEADTGRLIHLCIEPEPGCAIQRSGDIISFFNDHLIPMGSEASIRRHIRVCHDVCHAAVMFEPQAEVIRRYREAGIAVGKVQVSSAIAVDFDDLPEDRRAAAVDQLRAFAEDKYLHQTVIRTADGEERFVEDLPAALDAIEDPAQAAGSWRIHFHVPIYVDTLGTLRATRSDITDCLAELRAHAADADAPTHFEVETYAWPVLPPKLQVDDLATGIAQELDWFTNTLTLRT